MHADRRRLLAAAALTAALASATTGTAMGMDAAPSEAPATGAPTPWHEIDHYTPASSRPPVTATPVVTQASATLPALSLALIPVVGAAVGGLAGLRRKRSDRA